MDLSGDNHSQNRLGDSGGNLYGNITYAGTGTAPAPMFPQMVGSIVGLDVAPVVTSKVLIWAGAILAFIVVAVLFFRRR